MAKKPVPQRSLAKKQPEKKVVPPKKTQILVAERNVDKRVLGGWKIVGNPQDEKGKVLGVKTNASDLILMEK